MKALETSQSNLTEKPVKAGENQVRDEKGKWIKGVSGNPNGKIVGTKNFDTIFREAIEKLAKDDPEFVKVVGKSVDDVDKKLVRRAIIEAEKGNYSFYKDNFDRRFGTAQSNVNVSSKLTISQVLDELEKP